jgi:hydrogenase-4 component F
VEKRHRRIGQCRIHGGLLIGFGLLSVAIGSLSLVIQRHYKRMLAYSSVEHMGLVSIGLALGPLGVFAAWLHVVNHTVAKSVNFLLAGRILHRYESIEIGRVVGLLRVMPWTGALFAAGVLALVGLPPVSGQRSAVSGQSLLEPDEHS